VERSPSGGLGRRVLAGLLAGVAQELAVDHVRQAALQAAQGLLVALALASFAQVVVPSGTVVSELADGHGVQGTVELAVPGAGEPVAGHVSGGRPRSARCRCRRRTPPRSGSG
jgi:hypothetical protein